MSTDARQLKLKSGNSKKIHQKTQLKKVKNVKDVTKMQSSNVHIQIAFKWFDKSYAKFAIKIATMNLQLPTIKENG